MQQPPLQRADLFPSPVWFTHVEPLEQLTPLVDLVLELHDADPEGRHGSNRGGWQTSRDLHHDARFAVIARSVQGVMQSIARSELHLKPEFELGLDALWANVNGPGDYNARHHHFPGPWISGVLYLSVPPGAGKLRFIDPRPLRDAAGYHVWSEEREPLTNWGVEIEPKAGLVLFFPAWLEHEVTASPVPGDRISLAFNARVLPGDMPPDHPTG